MSTVIYLANQQIQIVSGSGNANSLNVKRCLTEYAPEGSIINGIVMDFDSFTEFIKNLKSQGKIPAKDVKLVINSTKFIGKNIEMPQLSSKKTLGYISREYQDLGRGDSVFGYITLDKGNKFKKIYSEAIEPEFIKDYVDIFANAGVKLNGIYSGEGSLIGFTGITAEPHVKTFELLIADANTLTTVLWVNGTFYYYNSVRCFHEQGTLEYADDIARSVSQITQFMKSNQLEEHLEKIYLSGINDDYFEMCKNAISYAGIGTTVQAFNFKSGGKYNSEHQQYIRAAAGLIEYDKQSNYLEQYIAKSKKKSDENKEEGGGNAPLIIGLTAVVMVAATVGLYMYMDSRQKVLDDIKEYNEMMLTDVFFYDAMMARNMFLQSQYESIVGIGENLDTYPRGNREVLNVFHECAKNLAEISYDSFSAEDGYIAVRAEASDVEDINKFIKKLTEQDIFNSVVYTGYNYDESTGMWNINVTCTLAESAGLKED